MMSGKRQGQTPTKKVAFFTKKCYDYILKRPAHKEEEHDKL